MFESDLQIFRTMLTNLRGFEVVPPYRTIDDVIACRRKGDSLNFVVAGLLESPDVWLPYGESPFSVIPQLYETDYVDMANMLWGLLPVRAQKMLARDYQIWYAEKLGLPDVSKTHTEIVPVDLELIPPMRYLMGESREDTLVDGFWMGKTEISQWQYLRVMGNHPSVIEDVRGLSPVTNVSYRDCHAFCKKTKTKLPTEAQWELACRAGTTTIYNFGDNIEDLGKYAWFQGNSINHSHHVATKSENAWGLHDMHGNVYEWCEGTFRNSGERRMRASIRGGAYWGWPSALRSDYAGAIRLSSTEDDVGFRVCQSLKEGKL